jgi:hypothetical protein
MVKQEEKPSVRITNQFRTREATMVYDLSCKEVRLTLQVSARQASDGLAQWHIEAFARQAAERPTVDDSGETRRDALRAVARAWVAKGGSYGFPTLDWDAVADALLAVRAI